MVKGFKDFILRGNVVDLAVAVVIGGAFGAVVVGLRRQDHHPDPERAPRRQVDGLGLLAARRRAKSRATFVDISGDHQRGHRLRADRARRLPDLRRADEQAGRAAQARRRAGARGPGRGHPAAAGDPRPAPAPAAAPSDPELSSSADASCQALRRGMAPAQGADTSGGRQPQCGGRCSRSHSSWESSPARDLAPADVGVVLGLLGAARWPALGSGASSAPDRSAAAASALVSSARRRSAGARRSSARRLAGRRAGPGGPGPPRGPGRGRCRSTRPAGAPSPAGPAARRASGRAPARCASAAYAGPSLSTASRRPVSSSRDAMSIGGTDGRRRRSSAPRPAPTARPTARPPPAAARSPPAARPARSPALRLARSSTGLHRLLARRTPTARPERRRVPESASLLSPSGRRTGSGRR